MNQGKNSKSGVCKFCIGKNNQMFLTFVDTVPTIPIYYKIFMNYCPVCGNQLPTAPSNHIHLYDLKKMNEQYVYIIDNELCEPLLVKVNTAQQRFEIGTRFWAWNEVKAFRSLEEILRADNNCDIKRPWE